MKHTSPFHLAAAIFLACLFPAAGAETTAPKNLLVPAGTDEAGWVDAWKKGYGCSLDHSADEGLVLRQKLPEGFSEGNHGWTISVPVDTGASYRFTVSYRLLDVGQAMAQFHFGRKDGSLLAYQKYRLSSESLSGTEHSWKELSYEFTVPAEAETVKVTLRLNSSGTVYWSKPELRETVR